MLPRRPPFTPNLEMVRKTLSNKAKKKKKPSQKTNKQKKKENHLFSIFMVIWKADLPLNGWSKLDHNVKLIMKTQRLLLSPS